MKVAILYSRLFGFDGNSLSVGGIQTYLLQLGQLIIDLGWEPIILQVAEIDFEREVNHIEVRGRKGIPICSSDEEVGRFLTNRAEEWLAGNDGFIIYGTESLFVKSLTKSVVIQHGVTHDLPCADKTGALSNWTSGVPPLFAGKSRSIISKFKGSRLNQLRRTWMELRRESMTRSSIRYMVCVDYNYFNVAKSQGRLSNVRTWVILNSATLASPQVIAERRKWSPTVKILFARRFFWYRGTRLIAPVFKRILSDCPDVSITFAGEGPDEKFLRDYFANWARVNFIRYRPEESADVMLAHDITVVPSLGSEGTSLSVIEAMASGCAVVATCVGGLTNIIIDDYNGKLVMPREEELYSAVYQVAIDTELRQRLAKAAFETVKTSLSIDVWRAKWRRVLLQVSQT